jgi:PAS domain S-box-containing protein
MSTPGQAANAAQIDIEQLRVRLADLEGEVVQLKAKPAPLIDAESLLENATDGFLVYDSEFQLIYVNSDGERLLGKPKTELLGKTHWDMFPETIGTEIERQYRRAMTERIAATFDNFYPPLETWLEIRVSPSAMGGLLVWLRDITVRRQAEIQREGLLREIQAERQILSEMIEKVPRRDFHCARSGFHLRTGESRIPSARTRHADSRTAFLGHLGRGVRLRGGKSRERHRDRTGFRRDR